MCLMNTSLTNQFYLRLENNPIFKKRGGKLK